MDFAMIVKPMVVGKQFAILDADVTATSITTIDSGLTISLAANSTYEFTSAILLDGDTDGMRFTLDYSGTVENGSLAWMTPTSSGALTVTVDAETTVSSLSGWSVFALLGAIRTTTNGVLKLTFRKNTDTGADTTISAGSYISARLLA